MATFVEEQKRREGIIRRLGPEALNFLESRIPRGTTLPDGMSPELWKALGNKVGRVSSWDILSKGRFENLVVQAIEYTQGQDAKRKAQGYGLGPAFADRYKNSTPAERAEFDNQQVQATRYQELERTLENRLGPYALEAGLHGERGTGKGTYDDEKRIPNNPRERIAAWVLKWGNGDLNTAIINRRKAQDKTDDEKIYGKVVAPRTERVGRPGGPSREEMSEDKVGLRPGQRPGLRSRSLQTGDEVRVRDVARPRGRGRFGVTGGQFRGAGTVARGHAAAGVVGRRPGGMSEGRFDEIASVRAEKARREDAAAKARTASSNKRVKKMDDREKLEDRRKASGLPAGATRDDLISAESQLEFLEKSKDPKNAENLGLLQIDRATGEAVSDVKGRVSLALLRISDSMRTQADSPLYPAFVPTLNKTSSGLIRPGPGPQGIPASGGPFIDISKLKPTPLDISEQLWEDLGKASEEDKKFGGGDFSAKTSRDQRYVDAFGVPGGPGTYVTKQSWMEAYSVAELERLKRKRYRIQKGTGKRVGVQSADEKRAARVARTQAVKDKNAVVLNKAGPLKPAEQRRKDSLLAGQERVKPKNAKRLAGINKIRTEKNLPPVVNVDAWGVPIGGWAFARDYETATAMGPGVPQGVSSAIQASGRNRGGYVRGYNMGGNVDSVSASLTPGEFVMRRESVRKYGDKFMNDVNLQKLNNGGSVGAGSAGASTGGTNVSQSKDLERGAKMAGDSILNAFIQGSQMVGDAIRQALAPESFAAGLGEVVGQKMQESIAATSIEMKGNMGVDVRLSGNGATGDISSKIQGAVKNAVAEAMNRQTNVDGSLKDPTISDQRIV